MKNEFILFCLNTIRSISVSVIRKLTRKRDTVEGKLERRDFLKDYSDPASQTYAPMSRIGVFLDRGSEQFVVKSRYLSTYQGLLELEASLPDYVMKPRIQAPKARSSRTDGFVKRKERRKFELEEVAKQLEDEKKPKEPPKPLRFLHKIEKPVPRPPTPSVEEPDQVCLFLECFSHKDITFDAFYPRSPDFHFHFIHLILLRRVALQQVDFQGALQ